MPREPMLLPVLDGAPESRAETLERTGWSRRFIAAPPRLGEMTSLYEALGYEIHLEPVSAAELPPSCGDCPAALALARVVYTRRLP